VLSDYALALPPRVAELANKYMPGPLTLLLPKRDHIPDLVTAGASLCAFRIPAHPMSLELLAKLKFPLAAPSANPFGYISPTTAAHVEQQLGKQIPYILDGGPCRIGLESTIVGIEGDTIVIYRKGGLSVEDIEAVCGKVRVVAHSSSNPLAPGMLKSHYAPRTPMQLLEKNRQSPADARRTLAALVFQEYLPGIPIERQIRLSPEGNLEEAARRLFSAMRELDAIDARLILAELMPERGLGSAINDRLRRAAAAN
jgi:L-threonylcarbamoyladenylate synthase